MSKKPLDKSAIERLVGTHKFNALKKAFGLEYKFFETTLADGTTIKVEPAIEEGASVFVLADGEEIPAPDGSHELSDGTVLVTEAGVVIQVLEAIPVVEDMSKDAPKVNEDITPILSAIADRLTNIESKFATQANQHTALLAKFNTLEAKAAKFAASEDVTALKSELADAKALVVKMADQSVKAPIKATEKRKSTDAPTRQDLEDAAVQNFQDALFGSKGK
jgi:hypothetical protein